MRRPSRARFVLSAAIVVVLLAGSDVRAAPGSSPEPVEWYDAKAQIKIEQMDRLLWRGRRVDFVFAGTSMVVRGINPQVFDEAGRERTFSYNAGLLSGVPPLMQRWLLEEVVPRLRPRVVVWGLSSIDFQERRYRRPVRTYERAPATRRGVIASLERVGAHTLKLIRFRGMLRDPKDWEDPKNPPGKRGPVERARKSIDRRGFTPKTWTPRGRDERARIRDRVLRDYEISERGTKIIVRVVRALRERGVEVVLVSMPVPTEYVELHPHGRDDFEAARQHIGALAEWLNVSRTDMSAAMGDAMFADFTHLDEQGAERFSRKLRRKMRGLGY